MSLFDAGFLDKPKIEVALHPWMKKVRMELVTTGARLREVIDECLSKPYYALDLETTGLDTRVFPRETPEGTQYKTNCDIVGLCLSPNTKTGYYIPVRHCPNDEPSEHNVPFHEFDAEVRRLMEGMKRKGKDRSVPLVFNCKFEGELMTYNGGLPYGTWDNPDSWEDVLILAYLDDSTRRAKTLKVMSDALLGKKQIELKELFPPKTKDLNFAELDPTDPGILEYAAADAICTLQLYEKLKKKALALTSKNESTNRPHSQGFIHKVEKLCLPSVRWMERNRLHIDLAKVAELIQLGQGDLYKAVKEVYRGASDILERDITPLSFYLMSLYIEVTNPEMAVTDDTGETFQAMVDRFRGEAKKFQKRFQRQDLGVLKMCQTGQVSVANHSGKGGLRIVLDAPKFGELIAREAPPPRKGVELKDSYDVLAPAQLGTLMWDLAVPGLKKTPSGQVATGKEVLEEVIENSIHDYPFVNRIKWMRGNQNALGKLYAIFEDTYRHDNTLKIGFRQFATATGRFSSKGEREPAKTGGTRFNLQSMPATYDTNRPPALLRIRECIVAPTGWTMVAIDFGGVELRLAANLSGEKKWIDAFFRCSACDLEFDRGDGKTTPPAPPLFCPQCGEDKIGDIHTLTAIQIFGESAQRRKDWKEKRKQGKCVHPDSILGMSGALRRIGSLKFAEEPDTFLKYPGTVFTGQDGEEDELRLLETYQGGEQEVYHVVSRRGLLTCTAQHRFLLADGTFKSIEQGLDTGDVLAEPVGTPYVETKPWRRVGYRPYKNLPEMGVSLSPDMAYFAGMFSGDGAKQGSTSVSITHGHVDKVDQLGLPYKTWQDIIVESCEKVGFLPTRKDQLVYLGSRHTMRFLSALGLVEGVEGKRCLRIPDWVLGRGPTALWSFLGGLVDTDGTVGEDGRMSWTSKDFVFSGQLVAVCHALGMTPCVEPTFNKTYQRWYVRTHIRASQAWGLYAYLRHPMKRSRLREAKEYKSATGANKVRVILPAGTSNVVDLHVAEPNVYWTNGLVVHNSANFALSYGGGPKAIHRNTGCGENEAYRIANQFKKAYTSLQEWWKRTRKFAKDHGYVITAFQRKFPLPDIKHEERFIRAKAERNAVNSPIQGSSADITKLAMGLIYKEVRRRKWQDKVRMIITMHDELVFEIRNDILEEACDLFSGLMVSNPIILGRNWAVPLTVDVELGPNWTVKHNMTAFRYAVGLRRELQQPGLDDDQIWALLRRVRGFYGNSEDVKGKFGSFEDIRWPPTLEPYFESGRHDRENPLTEEEKAALARAWDMFHSGSQGVPKGPAEDSLESRVIPYRLSKVDEEEGERIAQAIVGSHDPEGFRLELFAPDGVPLDGWFPEPVLVDRGRFVELMDG